eukprot:TCONS_00005430-protein
MFSRIFDGRQRQSENRPLTNPSPPNSNTAEYQNPVYDDGASLPKEGDTHSLMGVQSIKTDSDHHPPEVELDNEDGDLFDIKAFEEMEHVLNKIDETKKSKDLKIEELDRNKKGNNSASKWRFGPAPIEDGVSEGDVMKIGSLEGTFNHKENKVFSELKIMMKNQPMHEVNNEEATSALLNYFAELGVSDEAVQVDYTFIEQLLISADINLHDKYGQSLMHEVAREWSLDFAEYLKLRGAELDHADNYGRTPLFVAVASNHVEMARWLLDNKANISQKTKANESQTLIHYAAKYNAIDCFDLLLEYGADPNEEDGNGQTPIFLAALYGRNPIAQHMLRIGISTFSVNVSGVLCIELIVQNLPTETAWQALEQYYETDNLNRREVYNMVGFSRSCMAKVGGAAKKYSPPNLLEILVDQQDFVLVTNPVVNQMIKLKGRVFATKYLRLNVFLYLLFTLLWTASISIRETNQFGWTYKVSMIVVLTIFGELISFHFMWKVYREYKSLLKANDHEKERLRNDVREREKHVHPRWEVEANLLNKEKDTIERRSTNYWSNGWNIIEVTCLVLSVVQFLIVMLWIGRPSTRYIHSIKIYYSAAFLVVVWIRLNNCFHYSQTVGAFVAMLGECVVAVARFGFLFLEFFIPFTCAFWVLFGGNRKVLDGNDDASGEYVAFENLVYQMYLLTIVGDYDYGDLKIINENFAQIFVGLYFVLVSVITLNLFIALMSEAIARINEKASAQAYLKEAEEITLIEKYFPVYRDEFENFLKEKANPWIVNGISASGDDSEGHDRKLVLVAKQISKSMQDSVKELRETKKSLDALAEKIEQLDSRHPREKRLETIQAINKISNFYNKAFNKVQRKTFYKVTDFIEDAITSRQYQS